MCHAAVENLANQSALFSAVMAGLCCIHAAVLPDFLLIDRYSCSRTWQDGMNHVATLRTAWECAVISSKSGSLGSNTFQ